MKSFLNSNIGRLRLLAILESSSLLLLLFISMPLKQLYEITLLTSIIGSIHGILFLLFVISTINITIEYNLKFKKTTWCHFTILIKKVPVILHYKELQRL